MRRIGFLLVCSGIPETVLQEPVFEIEKIDGFFSICCKDFDCGIILEGEGEFDLETEDLSKLDAIFDKRSMEDEEREEFASLNYPIYKFQIFRKGLG